MRQFFQLFKNLNLLLIKVGIIYLGNSKSGLFDGNDHKMLKKLRGGKMKKLIKSVIPLSVYYKIQRFMGNRYWDEVKKYFIKSPFPQSLKNENKFIIFGTPTHGNLGDQAIVRAEVEFLKLKYKGYKIIEVPDEEIVLKSYFLKKRASPGDIIFMHGGGNMGELYLDAEIGRRKVIERFSEFPIIQFPQSYTPDTKRKVAEGELSPEEKLSQQIYSKMKKNLTIIARETKSFEKFLQLFPENNVVMTPDIVLTLNEQHEMNREGIMLCLRNDVERIITDKDRSLLIDTLKNKYHKVTVTDTVVPYKVYQSTRDEELNKIWNKYRTSNVVITDRLHGMVFGILTGTPCIVFDNFNSKVKKTYFDWLQSYSNIRFVNVLENFDINEVVSIINEIESGSVPVFEKGEKYKDLTEAIEKNIVNKN